MTPNPNTKADGSLCLAFPGRGRDLHVWLAPGAGPDKLLGVSSPQVLGHFWLEFLEQVAAC